METFEECMERLFTSLASGKSYKSLVRLDLFRELFNDQKDKYESKITKLETKLNKAIEALEYCYDNEHLNILDYISAIQIKAKEALAEIGGKND